MLHLLTDWSPLTRGVIAFVIAFGISLLIGEKVILKLISLKLGQPVRDRAEVNELYDLHGKKAGTPTMGGVMIIATLFLGVILAADLSNPFIQICLVVLLALGWLGFKDDYAKISAGNAKGVSSKFKLVWQFGVAALVACWVMFHPAISGNQPEEPSKKNAVVEKMDLIKNLSSSSVQNEEMATSYRDGYSKLGEKLAIGAVNIPGTEYSVNLSWLAIGFFIVVVVGASNAVNLTDGLDGLASGCAISTGVVYAIISIAQLYITKDFGSHPLMPELFVFNLAMVGAVAGFLWFNAYPAKMFMGDTGSLALGGVIGTIAICTKQEFLLVIVGFVFVMEAMSVMLQVGSYKLRGGKRIFKCAPIHHHFELIGWKETTVITRFWIVSVISGGLGLFILFS